MDLELLASKINTYHIPAEFSVPAVDKFKIRHIKAIQTAQTVHNK